MNSLLEVSDDEVATAPASGPPHRAIRLLVVEDDGDIRRLSTRVLSRSGYRVDAAEDGAAAWVALTAESYDLLIADHNMPKLTGVELLKKLRAARMDLPVVMVTGAIPTEELSRHPWLKLAATLRKPFTSDEPLATVKEVLRATAGATESIPPSTTTQSHPSADGRTL